MDCRECCHLLPLYVDEALTQKNLEKIRNHLSACQHCSKEFARLSETIDMVCHLQCVEPPTDFHQRLMGRIREECLSSTKPWPIWNILSISTVAATAMVLLTLTIFLPQKEKFTQPPQAPVPAKALMQKKNRQLSASAAKPQSSFRPLARTPLGTVNQLARNPLARFKNTFSVLPANYSLYQLADFESKSSPLDQALASNSGNEPLTPQIPLTLDNSTYQQAEEWSGENSNIVVPTTWVIRTPIEWQTFSAKADLPQHLVKATNWQQQHIVAIFLGKKPGRGYEIKLLGLQTFPDKMLVEYFVRNPQTISPAEESQPYLLFAIPACNLPVEFSEKK